MLHHELAATARAWQTAGHPAVVVRVQAHRGSVPREAGAVMLVAAEAVLGTIGGGHLELQAIARARSLLAEPTTGPTEEQRVPLGPALGQCCGGEVLLAYSVLARSDIHTWALPAPRFALHLFGAGHVGRAVVRLLEAVPCRVVWVDEREDEFPHTDRAPHIERRVAEAGEPLQAEVASALPGSFYLVTTHSHALDLRISLAVLQRADFGWFGLIGSATKRATFERRLAERGIAPALLQRMVCPIGLPGLRGKEPGVIAVAVVAQMLLVSATP